MKKIVIAYHAYLFGDKYMDMISEQLNKLISWQTGLYDASSKLYIGVVDSSKKKPLNGIDWISNYFCFGGSKKDKSSLPKKVEVVIYKDNNEETNTLKWIRNYAKKNPGDYILYFHTKGITRMSPGTESWRRYMEYFTIEKWKDCIAKLQEGFDCCGVLWNVDTPLGLHPHFSGNVWWATTDYINTLDHEFLDTDYRFDREFWIGTGPDAKVFEFHNSGLNNKMNLLNGKNHYNMEYPRASYTGEIKIHVIVTVHKRILSIRRLVYNFLLQTNKNWTMSIVQDGAEIEEIADFIASLKDNRISYNARGTEQGAFGFPNRDYALHKIAGEPSDYVLFTNDDNEHLQIFVESFLKLCNNKVGFIYCNTIHNYLDYDVLKTQIKVGYIDMGSFIVRLDIARKIGFSSYCEVADGIYAEECAAECIKQGLQVVGINKSLFIHN
jgi:hypothetical protein